MRRGGGARGRAGEAGDREGRRPAGGSWCRGWLPGQRHECMRGAARRGRAHAGTPAGREEGSGTVMEWSVQKDDRLPPQRVPSLIVHWTVNSRSRCANICTQSRPRPLAPYFDSAKLLSSHTWKLSLFDWIQASHSGEPKEGMLDDLGTTAQRGTGGEVRHSTPRALPRCRSSGTLTRVVVRGVWRGERGDCCCLLGPRPHLGDRDEDCVRAQHKVRDLRGRGEGKTIEEGELLERRSSARGCAEARESALPASSCVLAPRNDGAVGAGARCARAGREGSRNPDALPTVLSRFQSCDAVRTW